MSSAGSASVLPNQRHLFDMPDEVAYLNCAYMGPCPRASMQAGSDGMARKSAPWEIQAADFYAPVEHLRSRVASLFDTAADNIALLPSVSYGIAIAASNVQIEAGKCILMLAEQFPSNVYAWQQRSRRDQLGILTVPRPVDDDWTTAILGLLDERVGLVALPQVHWADGTLIGLDRISDRCRQLGIPLVLDLTQSLGVMPFSIDRIQPDFVFTAAYKWLLGPYGLTYGYISPEYQQGTPLEFNWISRRDSQNFTNLVNYTDDYQPGARRYDFGQHANLGQLAMAAASVDQILDWGIAAIAATLDAKTEVIAREAEALGYRVAELSCRGPHLLGLVSDAGLPADLAERLKAHNVTISVRGNALRISPYLYNTEADIDRLLSALR